jgi:hypothetical protein
LSAPSAAFPACRLDLDLRTINNPTATTKTAAAAPNHGHACNIASHVRSSNIGHNYAEACGENGIGGRAAALNALFDEWSAKRDGQPIAGLVRYGTVDWLFREYKQSKAYIKKVALRSRPDYERTMLLVSDMVTKKATGSGIERSRQLRQ